MSDLIAIDDLPTRAPGWPLSPWSTRRMIRSGELGCVKIGRRIFVTQALLDEYVRAHTVPATASNG